MSRPQAMRILSLSTLFPNRIRPTFGIFVGNQMRAVAARGDVDLTVVSPVGMPLWPLSRREPYRSRRAIPDRSEEFGTAVHYPRFNLIPKIGGDTNPQRILRAIMPLVRRLHDQAPFDLIDASFFFPDGPVAAAIARDLNLPLTVKSRGADIHYWGSRTKAREQMLAAADQAAALLAVSGALRQDMIDLGMPEDRIKLHYTGLDHGRFRPIARSEARAAILALPGFTVPSGSPLLITPGALIARKGQRYAIDALAQLPKAHLALAGAGEDEAALKSHVKAEGLGDRVHFLGQLAHDQLANLLCAADVMVLPSASEGLANVWVEALACGTPIVIPDIGGAREVVSDPSAGRIVECDSAAIAAAVSDLLANPPSQTEVAANAARFSWEKNAARIVEIWRDAIDQI